MEPTNDATGPSRRRILGIGAATAGAAWIAPSIISVPAASAATQQPPPGNGSINGFVQVCGREVDPDERFLVTAIQNPGAASGSSNTNESGGYAILGLPAGTYDITLHPNGPGNNGQPDESFKSAVVVPDGGSAFFGPNYQANGC